MQSLCRPSSEFIALGCEPWDSGCTLTWDESLLAQCALLIEVYWVQYRRSVSAQSVRQLGMHAPSISSSGSNGS
jgi:hypothetical protein